MQIVTMRLALYIAFVCLQQCCIVLQHNTMCSGTAKAAQLAEFKSPTCSVQGKHPYSPHLPTFGNGVTVIS